MAVLSFESDSTFTGASSLMAQLRAETLAAVLRQGQFAVVERDQSASVEKERELQKSESFLDGKTVAQGRAIGAQLLLSGIFEVKTSILRLKITDVAQNTLVASVTCDLSGSLETSDDATSLRQSARREIRQAVAEMTSLWAAQQRFALVRILEEKSDKARLVLLAGGTARSLKKGMSVDVFYIEQEEIDGEMLERFVVVGKADIELVENANFSQAKIVEGGKALKPLLASGKKLYCRLSVGD